MCRFGQSKAATMELLFSTKDVNEAGRKSSGIVQE